MASGSGTRESHGPDTGRLADAVVGSAPLVAFGAGAIAAAGAVVAGMVVMLSYAGFASPLVVVIAFVASLCCASSIAEFARRVPSAGSLYTFNSRGLGQAGGFLTGWMMVFARTHMLTDLLPFATFGWLGIGAVTLGVLKLRSSSRIGGLGRATLRQTGPVKS